MTALATAITMCIVYKVFDVHACIIQVYCSAHPPSGIALYTQNIVTNRLILSIWERKTFHTQYGHPWWSSRKRYKIGVELNLWTKIKWKKQQQKLNFSAEKWEKKRAYKTQLSNASKELWRAKISLAWAAAVNVRFTGRQDRRRKNNACDKWNSLLWNIWRKACVLFCLLYLDRAPCFCDCCR